jgi:hypothetical protein
MSRLAAFSFLSALVLCFAGLSSAATVIEADPGAYLIVNDYYVLADGCPKFLKLVTLTENK